MTTLAYDIIARDRASSTFRKIAGAAGLLGGAFGGAALAQFLKKSVDVEAQFSQTMASLQVNSGVSEKSLESLSRMAVKFGQDTVFSANEAAQAMLELSKGGMTAAQIKGGALQSTLQLAATEGIELDRSATILSQTLHTFGLRTADAGKAVDLLAAGAVASTAGVEDMSAGLKYAGSTAASIKYQMNDVVTALAALNNAGLDSTTAGTSLNRMMLGLSLTTKKASDAAKDMGLTFEDAKGNIVPMETALGRLDKALDGMTATERTKALKDIFGVEGMRAANILLDQGAKGWGKLSEQVNKAGVAAKMADARMSGTKGSLEQMSGSAETAMLMLGKKLAPAVQTTADYLAKNLVPAMEGVIDFGEATVDAVEPFVPILQDMGDAALDVARFLDDMPGPLKEIAIQAGLASLAMPRLSAAATSVGAQFTVASAKVKQFYAEMTYAETRSAGLTQGLSKMGGMAKNVAGVAGMVALTQATQESDLKMQALMATLGGAATGFAVGGPIGAAVGGLGGLMLTLSRNTDKAGSSFRDSVPAVEEWANTLDSASAAASRNTRLMILNSLQKQGAIEAGASLGLSSRTLVDAVLGESAALSKVSAAYKKAEKEGGLYVDMTTGSVVKLTAEQAAADKVHGSLLALADAGKKARREAIERAKVTQDLTSLYGKIPKKVITALEQEGVTPTLRGIAQVTDQYDLVPKQVKSLIEALGVDYTVRQVERVKDRLASLDGSRASTYVDVIVTRRGDFAGPNVPDNIGGSDFPSSRTRTPRGRAPLSPRSTMGAGAGGTGGLIDVGTLMEALSRMRLEVVGLSEGQGAYLINPRAGF